MICNYQNINDLCSKQYSYSFIDIISNNGVVDVDRSENALVLRTDNFTGTTKILSPNSTDLISTCSSFDDNEGVTEWECYIIYRYLYNGKISDPPLDILKNGQKNIINDAYDFSLSEGIQVAINNQPVVLASSLNDQIVYKSILSYAQALYDDNSDAVMPVFTDINNNQYSLLYDDLILVFKEYFTKVVYYKNLKDTLINEVDKALSLNDCQNINWCSTKPLVGNLIPTKIIETNVKNAIQNCEDISEINSDCDPPCDPGNCESCIDGSCESLCGEDECCIAGACGPCDCEDDMDCPEGECCIAGVCGPCPRA